MNFIKNTASIMLMILPMISQAENKDITLNQKSSSKIITSSEAKKLYQPDYLNDESLSKEEKSLPQVPDEKLKDNKQKSYKLENSKNSDDRSWDDFKKNSIDRYKDKKKKSGDFTITLPPWKEK